MLGKNVDMRVRIKSAIEQAIIKNRRFPIEMATAMIGDVRTSALKKIIEKTKKKRNRSDHVATQKKLRHPRPFITGLVGRAERTGVERSEAIGLQAKRQRDEFRRVSSGIGRLCSGQHGAGRIIKF